MLTTDTTTILEVNKVTHQNDEQIHLEFDKIQTISDHPKVGIIGLGNYGRALALRFHEAGLNFAVGSRHHPMGGGGNGGVFGRQLFSYEDTITRSEIVFLTVPSHAFGSVVEPLSNLLRGKIVVDVSNLGKKTDPSNATLLQSMIPLAYVVKALNTVSAYTLEQASYGASRETFVCGDHRPSKEIITQLLREIGLNPIDRGTLHSAIMVERLPFNFFPGWGTALFITGATLLPIWFFTYLRFFWYNTDKQIEKNRNDLGLYFPNRIIAWTMFWVLGLVYLPGILAGFIQLWRGTKYSRFPNWLDNWMKCRKQLGLICLLLASIHGVASCLLMGAGELKHAVENKYILQPNKPPVVLYQLLPAKEQWSLMFACLAVAMMAITGITSLPSVNAKMSWLEWDFVQRGLGFTSFLFGFVHVMVYVVKLWDPDYEYGWKSWVTHPKGNYPPGAFIMPMFPLLVIFLKVVLMFPGLSCYLDRIRKGRTGYKHDSVVIA